MDCFTENEGAISGKHVQEPNAKWEGARKYENKIHPYKFYFLCKNGSENNKIIWFDKYT